MTRATWRELRWAAIAWRRSDCRLAGERLLQLGFALRPEPGLDDLAAELRDPREDLVRRAAPHEHDHRAAVVVELHPEAIHELVLDPDVLLLADRGAGGGPDRRAQQRREEDEADHHSPAGAARSALAGRTAGLVELDLAFAVAFDHDHVVELDRPLFGQLLELRGDGLRSLDVGVGDGDQVAHG